MTTVLLRIDQLRPTPDEVNPNKMTADEQRMLDAAWEANEGLQPILVTPQLIPGDGYTHTVVDGEHRRRAAVAHGDEEIEAVVKVYNDAQIKLLRISMNKNRGDVDLNIAKVLLLDLIEDGYTIAQLVMTGFNEAELNEIVADSNEKTDKLIGSLDTSAPTVADKPHVLEIAFANVEQLKLARRALKKAAGESKDLGLGLLNLIGDEG